MRRRARVVATGLGASAGMALDEIPDLDHPGKRGAVVRVARRVDPLQLLLDLKSDAQRQQYDAAERFRDDSALAEGRPTRSRILEPVTIFRPPSDAPMVLRLDAQRRVAAAWLAIRGAENNAWIADVVRLSVLGMAALVAIDAHFGWRDHSRRSRGLLFAGLERLADHYG